MTAQPIEPAPGPVVSPYEVIHLGGQAAVVVPIADFLRLRALEAAATEEELQDAEDLAALHEWKHRQANGQTAYVPADEVRLRLGFDPVSLSIVYEEKAIDQAAGFLSDDPDGLRTVLDAIDGLVRDPRPDGSFPFGSPDVRRLRVGRYRVLYEVLGDVITVGRIARAGATG